MTSDERTLDLCRLVHLVVRSIADDGASIKIEPVVTAGDRIIIQIHADETDYGKLIGRGGRVAEALRELVRAYQRRQGGSYGLNVRSHQ